MEPETAENTFWGHIEELRATLLRMAAVVIASLLFSFFWYQPIIDFLTGPILKSSSAAPFQRERIELIRISNNTTSSQEYTLPEEASLDSRPSKAIELLSDRIFSIPPGESLTFSQSIPAEKNLVILGPLEGISIALKTSLWVGLTASSPIWMLLLMQFLAPALRREEKRLIFPFLITSLVFIGIGCGFAFFVTIPFANSYLSSFNSAIGSNMWSLTHYLDYTLFLMLANGIAFEFFAIGLFSIQLGLITSAQMIAYRRHAIVSAFILGAILTPPDVLTQLLLAIPLIILYEAAILYARLRKN